MKKIKNAMLLLACGLVATTLVTTSCKKDPSTPASTTPTITAVTPTSGLVGATVTITGTNLTVATVSFNGTAAVTTSVTATSITCTVPAGATTGNITVTTTSGTATYAFTVSTPALSSNDVAAANLIGHWTFDTDSKEAISHAAAATVTGVTFTTAGKIGNCATFSNGFLVYNPIDLINRDTALQSYSVSMWVKMPTATGSEGLRSLFQVNGNRFPDLWGLVSFELSNNGVHGDSLALQTRQIQVDGLAPYVHSGVVGPTNYGTSGNWTFITQTYNGNGNNQTVKLYANGVQINTLELTTVDKSITSTQSTFRVVPTGGSATPTPANLVTIGTLAFSDLGTAFQGGDGYGNTCPTAASRPWASKGITGSIDDIRLFNKALTAQEVTDLFTRGTAGN